MGSDGFVDPGLCLGNPAISRHGLRPSISILSEMLKAEGSVLLLYYSYWSSGRLSFYLFNHFGEIFSSFQKSCKDKNDAKKKYIPFPRFPHPCLPTPLYIHTDTCVFIYHYIFLKLVESKLVMLYDSLPARRQVHFINKCSVSQPDNTILDIGVIFFLIYG